MFDLFKNRKRQQAAAPDAVWEDARKAIPEGAEVGDSSGGTNLDWAKSVSSNAPGAEATAKVTAAVTPKSERPPQSRLRTPAATRSPLEGSISGVLAAPPPELSTNTRYEIREEFDGWSIDDNRTGFTADVYGFRLSRLKRLRAESIAQVLNRSEVRRLDSLRGLGRDGQTPR